MKTMSNVVGMGNNKKVMELLFRWYNLASLRVRAGQPGAFSESKLAAEENFLLVETSTFVGDRLSLEPVQEISTR